MDEHITETTEELNADQQDAFLAGWDDETSPETAADQPAEQMEESAQTEPEGENPMEQHDAEETQSEPEAAPETPEADAAGSETSPVTQQEPAAPTWTVKHMDQSRTFRVEDVTPELLQKGLDYDRIRSKYDESKPVMEMIGRFATQAGMNTSEYVKHIRAEAKRAGGMSEADAKRAVELEDREAAVSAKEAQQQANESKREAGKNRISEDVADFRKAFPQVYEQAKSDPGAIPQSVWKDVNSGMSLSAAYARYAVDQAQREAQEATQRAEIAGKNQRNAQRGGGSMKSAGSDTAGKDAFLEGWDS